MNTHDKISSKHKSEFLNMRKNTQSHRLQKPHHLLGGKDCCTSVSSEKAEGSSRKSSEASGDDQSGGEKGGDGDGDGVNGYLRLPGPTLTGRDDGGVGGDEEGEAVLLDLIGSNYILHGL